MIDHHHLKILLTKNIEDQGDKKGLLFFACRLVLRCYRRERNRVSWSWSCWFIILPFFYSFLSDPSIIWATKVFDYELKCPIYTLRAC